MWRRLGVPAQESVDDLAKLKQITELAERGCVVDSVIAQRCVGISTVGPRGWNELPITAMALPASAMATMIRQVRRFSGPRSTKSPTKAAVALGMNPHAVAWDETERAQQGFKLLRMAMNVADNISSGSTKNMPP
jgi:hypothetical protein